jgi:hypothetical protein
MKTVILPEPKKSSKSIEAKRVEEPIPRKIVQEPRWKHAVTDCLPFLTGMICDDRQAVCDMDPGTIRLIRSQIRAKLSSYRSQDCLKENYREDQFIGMEDVVRGLVDCGCICHFCSRGMKVLYEDRFDPLQWSLDRIDNDQGHNRGNVHMVCLGCNLKRRRQDHDRFFFTKKVVWLKEGSSDPLGPGPDSFV